MSAATESPEFQELARKVGEKVRAIRKERSMSQLQLATRIGVDIKTVQNIELGQSSRRGQPSNPQLDTMWAIAGALGVDVVYFLRDEPADDPRPTGSADPDDR